MKPTTFYFFIYIFFALIKLTLLEEEDYASDIDFIGIAAENYKQDKESITFRFLFMNLSKKPIIKTFRFITNITYFINSSVPNNYVTTGNCTIENSKNDDDYMYFNCVISINNIFNISNIDISGGGDYFGGEVVPGYLIYDPFYDIRTATKEIYILNLTKEIEEKHGQFILKGEMHKNLNDNEEFKIAYNDMNGTLNCQKTSGLFYECKLIPTSLIQNRSLEQRAADSSKSKIIIVARFLKNLNIQYPKSSTTNNPNQKNAKIIYIGNFNHTNTLVDAIGKIYLTCKDYSLIYLKEFIRFYVDINYNTTTNLRMLQNKEQIEVVGTKNLSEISKSIVSYDLTYKNTTNKTIREIYSPCNISFSDNGTFNGEDSEMNIDFNKDEKYEFLNKEEKSYEIMYLKSEYDDGNYDAKINSDSFSFGFDTQNDILNIENNTNVEVSYKPDNEERYFDNCNLEKIGNNSYNIICSPKRSVHALMNTLRIDITNLLKKKILKSVSARILQSNINTTLIPDSDSTGVINYDPTISTFIPKRVYSRGLSGGEIAAIIIAPIVAILAVLFLIFFFNKSPSPSPSPSPPAVKNNSDIIFQNSSTNINK